MCGLTGVLCTAPRADIASVVRKMNARLVHRGPDDEGVWSEGGIGLGHRRLAVLDLSPAGAQPMHSACGRYVLAYNGEIYNHLELRRALEAAGAAPQWRGQSDTETLLAAIAHWGLDAALRCAHGMFALALWDRAEKRLSLARDRMGEKPLYWGWAGRSLIFASTPKALSAHPDFGGGIDPGALAQYFRFMYVPAPRSIYSGIYKLEPGTILEACSAVPSAPPSSPLRPGDHYGALSIRRYWSLKDAIEAGAGDLIQDEQQAIYELERVLSSAVRRQMLSDVPLGAFLSGGVDSSTIVALMQAQSSRPVRTFTVGFDEKAFDESPHAEAVARHLGTDHLTLRVTDAEALAAIPELPELYDEPFADSSQLPTFLVCRAARQHVTVALSGDGGDELFGGYNRYFWGPKIWDRFEGLPHGVRVMLGAAMAALPISMWNAVGAIHSRLGGGGVAFLGDKVHRLGARLKSVRNTDDLYRSLVSELDQGEPILSNSAAEPPSCLDDVMPSAGIDHPSLWMMAQDLRSYLPDDILCKVDRAAMGVSLETRVPFLDPEVIALACRLPLDTKIRHGTGKWALRQVLYRHVPQQLIDRPKAGFGIPVGQWLRGPLREWAEDMLTENQLEQSGLLNPAPIRQIWAEHLSGKRDRTARLWSVLMFQAWRTHWR